MTADEWFGVFAEQYRMLFEGVDLPVAGPNIANNPKPARLSDVKVWLQDNGSVAVEASINVDGAVLGPACVAFVPDDNTDLDFELVCALLAFRRYADRYIAQT